MRLRTIGLLLALGCACASGGSGLQQALVAAQTKDDVTAAMGTVPRCAPRRDGGEDCEWRRHRGAGYFTVTLCRVAPDGAATCSWHIE